MRAFIFRFGLFTAALAAAGCHTNLSGSPTPLPSTQLQAIYVSSPSANKVLVFGGAANGNVAPKSSISGNNTMLDSPQGLAVDASGDLFVANASTVANGGSITEYPQNATGNVTPLTRIFGNAAVQLSGPEMITLGPTGQIYVTNNATHNPHGVDTVSIFPAGSNGPVQPQYISGNNTQLSQPSGVAVAGDGSVYVANTASNAITIYASDAQGNTPPLTTISGNNTGLNRPFGLTFDSTGQLWVGNSGSNTIAIFAAGTVGNVAPAMTISGGNTHLANPLQIGFDRFDQFEEVNANNSFAVFGPLPFPFTTGNIAPQQFVSGNATQLVRPIGIAAY